MRVDRPPTAIGQITYRAGFFGKAAFLRLQPSGELERRLGYRAGRLSKGWWLLFMVRLPQWNEFEVAGYSHLSGGVVQGHLPAPPDRRPMEKVLRDTGVDMVRIKKQLVKDTFTLSGSNRLAKVVPLAGEMSGGTSPEYPQGTGIPQWRLTVPAPFKAVAFVGPGEVYQGMYQ